MTPGLLESLDITTADMTPDHLATVIIGFISHGAEFVRMIQQIDNLTGKLSVIMERKQPAPAVGE